MFVLLPTGTLHAADASSTPHLDIVQKSLKETSPGLEGSLWQRTEGNKLDNSADKPASWLLQTPGCWGDAACKDRSGTDQLIDRMTQHISQAERSVDISGLAPFPDGRFQDAIVKGLQNSVAAGHSLEVRMLVGAAPIYHIKESPLEYKNRLVKQLGSAADKVKLNVASMTTSAAELSWSHSKLLVVDGGKSAMTGGINNWSGDYIDNTHPVWDVNMSLTGPAGRTAAIYLDSLWDWTCGNVLNPLKVRYADSKGATCMKSLPKDPGTAKPGDVTVLSVGGLGVGIKKNDPTSTYNPTLPTAEDATCLGGFQDNTNADRDYDTVNPEENALRSLISSATKRVDISQQDVNAACPPWTKYDIRAYDAMAAKLLAGVKVRMVVSDPANYQNHGLGGYSQIKSMNEISDVLRNRLNNITKDSVKTKKAMCENLQLAPFRSGPGNTWADGKPYALHHKLISVDDEAFYLGSKNLYPNWLQDFGYVVENKTASAHLKSELLDQQWKFSKEAATYDYERNVCAG
ncbi:phospholipase [Pseudonocardiaceae bacterium YIM PH 21723]|nr:phospholipase [Pseudonocardiaceae bacterium YIM PH 21723]